MTTQYISNEIMVTIRCATYNHEPYIRQCLEGFVMQKTNFRFEAVVHDDASTDKTADIIREFAEKYPEIIKPIYQTENQYSKHDGSLTRIMNAHTKGKYIAFCEGDDYWIDPLKLQKQVDYLEANEDYSVCGTAFGIFDERIKKYKPYNNRLNIDKSGMSFSLIDYVNGLWPLQTLTVMFRKSSLGTDFKYPYDAGLYYELLKNGNGFILFDETAIYRLHDTGVWSSASYKNHLLRDISIRKIIHDSERSKFSLSFLRTCIMSYATTAIKKGCFLLLLREVYNIFGLKYTIRIAIYSIINFSKNVINKFICIKND